MNKLGKRKILLIVYAIIILILLIAIMFIIPDSFFIKKYEGIEIPSNKTEKKEFIDYEIQKEHLINNQYEYEYVLLDSMSKESNTYKCSGKTNKTIESGSCTSPEVISYTEKDKKEVFSKIDINYLNPTYIFNKIKNITPKETKYVTLREYNYQTMIEDLDTEIIIYTDLDEITKIEISNAYMTYILKYSNVSY